MPRPLIALDADGVLLDFHEGYARAWEQAFGSRPHDRDPLAYWPMDRWAVERLDVAGRQRFRQQFGAPFWKSLPALPGAVQACVELYDAGFDLVCVSALDAEHESARLYNLRQLGFPIERVIATGNEGTSRSPKADVIAALAPLAFVDDYLPYMRGIGPDVYKALVLRAPNGSPNQGDELAQMNSVHDDLAEFATHWLGRDQPS